jgi:parallel beta-helix repeat protein
LLKNYALPTASDVGKPRMKTPQRLQALLLMIILGLTATSGFPTVKANADIIINPDGSLSPPDAPITRNGEIFSLTNDVHETIVIQRNNTALDGQGYNIHGNMANQGITLSTTRNITVKNVKISGFSTGIKITHSIDNTVVNITATNCTYGILVDQSPRTKITDNTIHDNKWDGIFITASLNSQITNNKVEGNGKWGIYMGYSSDCTLKNNQMNNNKYNFGVSVDFYQDIDTSNTINGHPIIYWINQQSGQIPVDASYVALVDSNNIEARNLQLTDNGQGITLVNSANNRIENCNITRNSYYGIALINSNYNTITNSTTTKNDGAGITLVSSIGNSITNNTIEGNHSGIHVQDSNDNSIHHNNFINNTRQAVNENSRNTWDSGSNSGGNYWSNYVGKDANNDGIGDSPYTIDSTNQDKYPLMTTVKSMPINDIDPLEAFIPFLTIAVMIILITAISAVFYKSRRIKSAPSKTLQRAT